MGRPNGGSLDDLLTHYGIKGMKWGVRRTKKQIEADSVDAAAAKATKAKISKNHGSTDPVSNKELQHLVNRMNLEQQYSRLASSRGNQSAAKKGTKFASDILANVAKQQATKIASDYASKAVAAQLKKEGK